MCDTKFKISNKTMKLLSTLHYYAETSDMNIKHAAGIVKNGKIIDISTNSHRSSYNFNGKNYVQCSLHAEMAVIRKLIYNLEKNKKYKTRKMNKYTLFVIRKNYSNSMPCKHCSKLIKKSGISKIYYSNGNPNKDYLSKIKAKNLKGTHQSRAVVISSNYLTN